MFSETPELYDRIYGSFKDYAAEARRVAELLAERAPEAVTVLDVACGTGEHARFLRAEHGYRVDGLDIEPSFVELARAKVGEGRFWEADMADFHLDARYDVVICLFSSIGYLESLERIEAAFRCFQRHLEPGGMVLVEPWITPGDWVAGRVYLHTSESEGVHVVRMSHSRVEGRLSKLEFHYLIGDADGIDHRVEHHDLRLSTTGELTEALERAGFSSVEHDPEGLTGRGLLVAQA